MQPRWRHDGRELFYLASDQRLMAVAVKLDPTFEAETPVPLFRTRLIPQGSQSLGLPTAYDVSPDDQRFVVTVTQRIPVRRSRSSSIGKQRLERAKGDEHSSGCSTLTSVRLFDPGPRPSKTDFSRPTLLGKTVIRHHGRIGLPASSMNRSTPAGD